MDKIRPYLIQALEFKYNVSSGMVPDANEHQADANAHPTAF